MSILQGPRDSWETATLRVGAVERRTALQVGAEWDAGLVQGEQPVRVGPAGVLSMGVLKLLGRSDCTEPICHWEGHLGRCWVDTRHG